MMRVGVKPIIFVLNNKGYTIERYLHGEKRKYNDVTNWYFFPSLFLRTSD
jgi:pyruvate decarboxylase